MKIEISFETNEEKESFMTKLAEVMKCKKMGKSKNRFKHGNPKWSGSEIKYLLNNRRTLSFKQLSQDLGRPVPAIASRLWKIDNEVTEEKVKPAVKPAVEPVNWGVE